MTVLNTPRPAWMTEDLVLLEEQASRFVATEYGPHLEKWHDDHMYPREVWTKAGQAGLLCAMIPEEYGGGGGSFAHEAVINRAYSLGGFDVVAGRKIGKRQFLVRHTPLARLVQVFEIFYCPNDCSDCRVCSIVCQSRLFR